MKGDNLHTHNNLHSFCYCTTIMFPILGYMIFMLWIYKKKAFLSTILLKINVHLWNETNLNSHNNLHSFCYGHYNHVLHIEIPDIDALDLQGKLFFFLIFLIIKIHPWNKTNLDTHNIFHSFGYGHYNHVLHFGIHYIDAFDLHEKLFFPPFSYNQSSSLK